MFETINKILELVRDALLKIDFTKWRKQKALNNVGFKLYVLYVSLNEVVIAGRKIVLLMEDFVQKGEDFDYGPVTRRIAEQKAYELRELIEQHGKRLRNVVDAVSLAHYEIAFIDAETFKKLFHWAHVKFIALDALVENYPDLLIEADPNLNDRIYHPQSNKFKGDVIRSSDWRIIRDKINERNEPDRVFVGTAYREMKRFLKESKPKTRLRNLETILRSFRTVLETHFTVEEMLRELEKRADSLPDKIPTVSVFRTVDSALRMDRPKTPLERATDDWFDRELVRDALPLDEPQAIAAQSFEAGARWLARELDDLLPGSGRSELKRLFGQEP